MEKSKYLIGDVANLMGISRDTLRYYEKRGLLTSEKGTNGYRYYTDQDIAHLVSILYQRKMNISIDDMETLWSGDDSISNLTEIMESRLDEEEKAIRAHNQTIARLRLTRSDCERINHELGQVSIRNSPSAYVIVPHTTRSDSTGLWFHMAKNYSGLDMMYSFDDYTFQMDSSLQLNYQNTQLVLYQELKDMVDYPIEGNQITAMPIMRCVYSLRASTNRIPCIDDIAPMNNWAKEHRVTLSDRIYSTYTMQGLKNGQHTYYLELYIPLLTY